MTEPANIARLPAQVVDTRYTQDVVPILDTSKFEHMQRIATVMAETSMLPESLRTVKGADGNPVDLPQRVVVANCFRIVNQAVRWGFDPFAVVDCASLVHGRLMWEGKLVAAVLDAKLGVKLQYDFDENPDQELGVTVTGLIPGETKPRTIFGRVKDWHKGPRSPWGNPGAWKRQMRYMGAREWARAHAPATMLGVYADDELDGLLARDIPDGQRAMRIKDITPPPAPKPAVLDVPDIPDVPSLAAQAEPADEPLPDPDAFLENLQSQLAACENEQELAEVKKANTPLRARLLPAHQYKMDVLYGEYQ